MLTAEREATRSNFLHSISHDIRTPLTSIIGNLDVLKFHSKSLDNAEKIKTINCFI